MTQSNHASQPLIPVFQSSKRDKLAISPEPLQHRHSIPELLLWNFSCPYEARGNSLPDVSRASLETEKTPNLIETLPLPRRTMLNVVDLKAEDASIEEWSLAKIMAFASVPYNQKKRKDVQHVEKMMSTLEKNATRFISKIVLSFDDFEDTVTITRPQRVTLRKYIFILIYRSSMIQPYSSDGINVNCSELERENLPAYRKQKGLNTLSDVWFDIIKAMLEVKTDTDGRWLNWLTDNAYPDEAMWFYMQVQGMYLTLCTPARSEDEFLLTENGFSIHEGPDGSFESQ